MNLFCICRLSSRAVPRCALEEHGILSLLADLTDMGTSDMVDVLWHVVHHRLLLMSWQVACKTRGLSLGQPRILHPARTRAFSA